MYIDADAMRALCMCSTGALDLFYLRVALPIVPIVNANHSGFPNDIHYDQ